MSEVSKAKENVSVSVIVPTLGRTSLTKCLQSWLTQTLQPSEIIIVADGLEAYNRVCDQLQAFRGNTTIIKILKNENRSGVSASFNKALDAVTSEYIALTSDDDFWVSTKLERQLEALLQSEASIVLTGAYYRRSSKWIVRPRRILDIDRSPLEQVFSDRSYPWTAARYIPMSSAVFIKEISNLKFDTKLSCYEDYWWLHEAFKLGHKTLQIREALIYVETDLQRSSQRETDSLKEFTERIYAIDPKLAQNFIHSHAVRASIFQGDFKGMSNIRQVFPTKIKISIGSISLLAWQNAATGLFWIFNRINWWR